MSKVYKKDNYIVLEDSGVILENLPAASTYYKESANLFELMGSGDDFNVSKNDLNLGNITDVNDAVYTVDTFREFLLTVSGSFRSAGGTASQTLVTQENKDTTIGGVIDSTKTYVLDGIIDMGTTQITVPPTGITIEGYSFDISGLTSSEDNYTMFISESVGIGSGNILGRDYFVSVTGAASKVYELYDATGFNAFEFIRVNYIDCTSLGDIYDYRQGLETGTGRFGGSPSLTLHGLWRGGYRITTSIVRNLAGTMIEPLFKGGFLFQMNSRFLTDMNFDLPTLAPLLDFQALNFPNPSTLQLNGCIATRDGAADSSDPNITPNIDQKSLSSSWINNIGLPNTFVGGLKSVSVELETLLSAVGVPSIILGTWVDSDLQHFDANLSYSLRHLGNDPKDFRVTFDFVLEGAQSEQYKIHLKKDSGGTITDVYTQTRTIDRLAGTRDVTYFSGTLGVSMNRNDFLYWEVENITSGANCTLEADSQWFVEAR